MSEVASALAGLALLTVVALIRVVWTLAERVARLEGRINGEPRRGPP